MRRLWEGRGAGVGAGSVDGQRGLEIGRGVRGSGDGEVGTECMETEWAQGVGIGRLDGSGDPLVYQHTIRQVSLGRFDVVKSIVATYVTCDSNGPIARPQSVVRRNNLESMSRDHDKELWRRNCG